MIKIRTPVPPRVVGTLFGPFAVKRLPRLIKAEDPSPPEPEAPPVEPPQTHPATESPTPQQPEERQEQQAQGGEAEPPPAPPEEPPYPEQREGVHIFWDEADENEHPAELNLPDGRNVRIVMSPYGEVLRVEGSQISVEDAQNLVDQIYTENEVEEEDPVQEEPEEPFQVPSEPPNTIKFTEIDRRFLHEMKDNYFDDTPRLIFADWMEDQGNSDLAEWVRISIRMNEKKRMTEDEYKQYTKLSDRLVDLMVKNEWDWPWIDTRGGDQIAEPHRGMLSITLTPRMMQTVLRQVPPERAFSLVDNVILTGSDPLVYREFEWIEYVPNLNLSYLSLLGPIHNDNQAVITAAITDYGKNLRSLNLRNTGFGAFTRGRGASVLNYLVNHKNLNNLIYLNLRGNDLSEENIEELILSTGLQNIQTLDLRANGITYRYNPTGGEDVPNLLRERFGNAVIL